MPLSRLLLPFLLLISTVGTRAGVVQGRVTDAQSQPLSFANVAARGTDRSAAANEQGRYQLRLPAGRYTLAFQYVGYAARLEAVRVPAGDSVLALDVALTAENYRLGEVVVRAPGRDPAYELMEQAIAWRRYHQREVAAYQARAYLKTVVGLTEMPSSLLGAKLPPPPPGLDPRVLRLEETVSELRFRQPGPAQERVISTRVSGRSQEFGSGGVAAVQMDLYQNLQRASFAPRGIVSPLADGALLHYRYELVGSSTEAGRLIHKIRVAPRHPQDPAYSGFIYLVDGSWHLHSVALSLDRSVLKDLESLHVEQQFMPAPGAPEVWVRQSQKLTFGLSVFGFKVQGTFHGVYLSYRDVVPAFPRAQPAPVAAASGAVTAETPAQFAAAPRRAALRRLTRQAARPAASDADALRPGEVRRVETGANERSAAYWDELRPVPLTADEQRHHRSQDSLEQRRQLPAYQDSLDRVFNRFRPLTAAGGGYRYRRTRRQHDFATLPLDQLLQYNTVEGVVLHASGTYQQRYAGGRRLMLTPTLRYGAAARLLSPRLAGQYLWQPQRLRTLHFAAGRSILDFNDRTQLTPAYNTYYTLWRNENYAKLYQQDAVAAGLSGELARGLTLRADLSYADRQPLRNHTDRLMLDVPGRRFTPNEPVSVELNLAPITRSQALLAEATLNWQPGQRYLTLPDRKVVFGSRYPTLQLHARQALPVLGADVRYLLAEAGLRHTQRLGLLGQSTLTATAGGFVWASRLQFMDYRHFAGNRLLLTSVFAQFQLLDYYRFSTRQRFVEAHWQHGFQGFLLNKAPLLRQLKLQEMLTLHYLHTPALGQYAEVGAGLQRDFLLLHARADVVTTLRTTQPRETGLRVRLWRDL
ncbi:DUF5686 and carboxypeptidase regulatory-like domain-containing protein [Hymenobacter sp. 15J16-1T3B]|uniref:DUF5686 and carboxypeptidase regulatory-like domain-containing protein n=1 Tax=Hymenobacter sp. 15J16-1T3B TaxID=2886941 RepID=UPI001D1232C6|nr:DUF5686 and carboxypeptidase regulatory-like domain-containing protein [Hymenobacter sp. 15J16-1T3B]MCC3157924.1 DUF5686 and carboxypeptidase regulatory-like domain-containing protein [Hymenobacter sp. 15J16-1T3B]